MGTMCLASECSGAVALSLLCFTLILIKVFNTRLTSFTMVTMGGDYVPCK